MEWSESKDISISVAALTGIVLGFWNLFAEYRKKKVNLRVNPKSASHIGATDNGLRVLKYSDSEFSLKGEPDLLAIEVINMSDFPVTISEVGFHAPKRNNRFAVPLPKLVDGGTWPRRLESREKVITFVDWSNIIDCEETNLIKCAYAKTDCGAYIKGNSGALKSFINQLC